MSGVQPRFPPFPVQLPVSDFRYCISCWANKFKVDGDPDDLFATFLYAISHHINMNYGAWEMSWWKIADEMVAMRRKFHQDLKPPSRSTINRMMKRAREYGIMETERTTWRNPKNGKVLPGDNRIFLNLNKIVVHGQELEHDFLAPVRDLDETPDDSEPATEGTVQVAEVGAAAGTPAAMGEASWTHRRRIHDASDEASMMHTTRLDTGHTHSETRKETCLETRAPASGATAETESHQDMEKAIRPRTTNSSAKRVLQTWASWHTVFVGSLAKDIGTSVSPTRLKPVLDGYASETRRGAENLNAHLGGERGLRQRLDRDLGLDLVYKSDERTIVDWEKRLASDGYIYPARRQEWEEKVAQFRYQEITCSSESSMGGPGPVGAGAVGGEQDAVGVRPRMSVGVRGLLVGSATAPTMAKPLEHVHFQDSSREVIHNFCGFHRFTVQIDNHVRGMFLLNSHGPDELVYGQETAHGSTTFTNLKNGKTFTLVYNQVSKDLKVTDNGDGTLTIIALSTGSLKVYGPDGKLLFNDPGQVRFKLLIDDNGTPTDPTDDELISARLIKGSTGRNDTQGRDFCRDVHRFTS